MENGYREKILEAMRWEDSNLRKHIEKHRLEEWTKETRKLAEQAVDEAYDFATETQSPATIARTVPIKKLRGKSLELTNGQNGAH
jgi:nuclear pore complex protein Nup133